MRLFRTLKKIYKILRSPRICKVANEDWQIRRIGEQAYWTLLAKKQASSCGKGLRVNHESVFSGTVVFGDNCNFNGIRV